MTNQYEPIEDKTGREFESPVEGGHVHVGHAHGQGLNNASMLFKVTVTVCLVICGAAMTLLIKAQDEHCIHFCDEDGSGSGSHGSDSHGSDSHSSTSGLSEPVSPRYFWVASSDPADGPVNFHQPFIQLAQMGLGQLGCILAFRPYSSQEKPPHPMPPWKDFVPAAAAASFFDAFAEVFVILGLTATSASTAEMMKATLVVFCGLFSIYFFPGFRLNYKQIIATGTMIVGATLVIMREYVFGGSEDSLEEVVGALFVLVAQLCYAGQFVVEERVVDRSKLRRQHVNKALLVFFEGVVSILMALVLQIPWTYIHHSGSDNPWGDFATDLGIYFTDPVLWATGIGLSFSVAGFDLFGLATAETMGSDRRAVITASFQVVIVWTISIMVGLESFLWPTDMLAVAGFIIIFGSGLFYSYGSDTKDVPRNVKGDHGHVNEYKPLNNGDTLPTYS